MLDSIAYVINAIWGVFTSIGLNDIVDIAILSFLIITAPSWSGVFGKNMFPNIAVDGMQLSIVPVAIGMSENSDAIVVVVSEETGNISVAENGELTRGYSKDSLKRLLDNRLFPF